MHELPTGTVTLFFSDIEGSTRHLQREDERYANVLEASRHLLRIACIEFHGHEVDTQGDAFFVAFARATDAVSAAVEAQRTLAAHAWPEGVAVRMGLHTGEPHLAAEGYLGLDVHRTARIMNAGHGGQILLSQTTRDLVEHELPEGASLRDLGAHRLKDLEHPSHLYQLVVEGLPAGFPPSRRSIPTHTICLSNSRPSLGASRRSLLSATCWRCSRCACSRSRARVAPARRAWGCRWLPN